VLTYGKNTDYLLKIIKLPCLQRQVQREKDEERQKAAELCLQRKRYHRSLEIDIDMFMSMGEAIKIKKLKHGKTLQFLFDSRKK